MTTSEPIARPVPVGELLERLRAEGFAVLPVQYGRVFTVVESVFPDGLLPETETSSLQTLRELIGPIVCRTPAEQDRFGTVFDSVMAPPVKPDLGGETEPKPPDDPPKTSNWFIYIALLGTIITSCLVGVWLWGYFGPDPKPDIQEAVKTTWPRLDCSINFGIQSVQGDSVTFVNRSPGLVNRQTYIWDFGDETQPIRSNKALVGHRFKTGTGPDASNRVTLKSVGCRDAPVPLPPPNTYNPAPLSFLRLPETSRYTLLGWVPLLLTGLGGLLAGGWWLARRERRQRQAAKRPTAGPFFLSFPPQDDAIQPSPSLLGWAQQLQEREESERHVLAVGPTIRQTIRSGGMPAIQYETIRRRPRYLVLIDDRSAYDQQAKLYAYVMSVLIDRSVEMDVFFFHSDPRYLWNENYPKGLPISDLFRLYSSHYLVLVTEGTRLLDYDRGEVADWAVEALAGWTSRALFTPVYPANWHYLEATLSRFFILLPATPDGQLLLRDYLRQPDSVPSFEDLLRQFRVLPGTPNRGIFASATMPATVADVQNFLDMPIQEIDQPAATRTLLFTWACATAVFPTPDWAMTLAIGRALEARFGAGGESLVTSTNILKLTALPWLRQDHIPEPLRTDLLAQLRPEQETVARQTVVSMLNSLKADAGSVAWEEKQLRQWEQEYHLHKADLGQLTDYRTHPDLIKDPAIQQQLARQDRLENKYQPAGLLLLALLPLLLYLTPPQTQVAGIIAPFFRNDVAATDSAAIYNNRALTRFDTKSADRMPAYGLGITDLYRSIRYRLTFEAVYNLNAARYNLAILRYNQQPATERTADDKKAVQGILSPFGEVVPIMAPVFLFSKRWVPDSATLGQYLRLLTTKAGNEAVYQFVRQANLASVNTGKNQGIGVNRPVNRTLFNQLVNKAESLIRLPGRLEFGRNPPVTQPDSLPNNNLLAFKPTVAQRDSLISLEAARIVFYFGGPYRSEIIPLETSGPGPLSPAVLAEITAQSQANKPPVPTALPSRVRPPVVRKKNTSQRPAPLPTAPPKDTTFVQKRPKSSASQQKENNQIIEQTPSASTTPPRTDVPVTVGTDEPANPPVQQQQQQQVQQQQIQQQTITSDLNEVDRQRVNCITGGPVSFALSKGDKQAVSPGIVRQLSNAPNLYELTLYCDSEPQRVYTKRGFSHIKIEALRAGFELIFYQTSRKIDKK